MKTTLPLLLAALALPAAAATLDTSPFGKSVEMTVSGYAGSTTLADFPVLVRLAAGSPTGFDYADCASDGSDIRFADAAGNLIPHEIDTWNAAGESLVWVRLPSVASGATFTMYFGADDPGAAAAESVTVSTTVRMPSEREGSSRAPAKLQRKERITSPATTRFFLAGGIMIARNIP